MVTFQNKYINLEKDINNKNILYIVGDWFSSKRYGLCSMGLLFYKSWFYHLIFYNTFPFTILAPSYWGYPLLVIWSYVYYVRANSSPASFHGTIAIA